MKAPLLPSSKSSTRRLGLVRGLFYTCLVGAIFLVSLWAYHLTGPSASSQTTATSLLPTLVSNADRLAQPTLIAPSKPTQLDQGALVYWGVCMACHGDRGQGLTDERRAVYGEDRNCWASKCHASNHPPQGFVIPRTPGVPAVAGPAALARFNTTQELYDYILISMPWWKPNSLTPERAWAVTAYTLKLNGTLPQGIVLDATDASAIPVHHLVTASQNDQAVELVLAAILVLIAVVMVAQATITT
jgi:mono/diheme cytochrome c family protein